MIWTTGMLAAHFTCHSCFQVSTSSLKHNWSISSLHAVAVAHSHISHTLTIHRGYIVQRRCFLVGCEQCRWDLEYFWRCRKWHHFDRFIFHRSMTIYLITYILFFRIIRYLSMVMYRNGNWLQQMIYHISVSPKLVVITNLQYCMIQLLIHFSPCRICSTFKNYQLRMHIHLMVMYLHGTYRM